MTSRTSVTSVTGQPRPSQRLVGGRSPPGQRTILRTGCSRSVTLRAERTSGQTVSSTVAGRPAAVPQPSVDDEAGRRPRRRTRTRTRAGRRSGSAGRPRSGRWRPGCCRRRRPAGGVGIVLRPVPGGICRPLRGDRRQRRPQAGPVVARAAPPGPCSGVGAPPSGRLGPSPAESGGAGAPAALPAPLDAVCGAAAADDRDDGAAGGDAGPRPRRPRADRPGQPAAAAGRGPAPSSSVRSAPVGPPAGSRALGPQVGQGGVQPGRHRGRHRRRRQRAQVGPDGVERRERGRALRGSRPACSRTRSAAGPSSTPACRSASVSRSGCAGGRTGRPPVVGSHRASSPAAGPRCDGCRAGVRVPQVAEQHGQPGPAAGAAALHRALGHAEHRRGLGDRVALMSTSTSAGPLLVRQLRAAPPRRPWPVSRSATRSRVSAGSRPLLGQRHGRPDLPAAHPVQAGVDHDPVQPGGDRRVAAERPAPPGTPRSARPAARRRPPRGRAACAARPPTAGPGAGGPARRTRDGVAGRVRPQQLRVGALRGRHAG